MRPIGPRMIGAAALLAATVSAADLAGLQVPTFRSGVRTVAVYATVQDREGRLVPDLTQADFQILDNGTPVPITTFSNEVLPFTAVLLLDMSNSILPAYFVVRESALGFVLSLSPQDRLRIGTFGREVALSPLLTNDQEELARIVEEELWPLGPTPLWRAATAGMDSLANEPGRRVILILSDGLDSGGITNCAPLIRDLRGAIGACPNRSDVMKQAQTGEFMFYAIGIPRTSVDGGLVSIVEETGGGHFSLTRDTDLNATFRRVAEELRHQYVLGFTPAVLDGKTHKLEVRPTRQGLTARTRKSYVARPDR
jgi:Ca-activated chloride channel family protein